MARTTHCLVFVAALLIAPAGACKRESVGGDIQTDGQAPPADGQVLPPPDGAVSPDAEVPGCEPQQAYEDPTVDCVECGHCDDLLPWMWSGHECVFAPICCACAGTDCASRFRTYAQCEQAYGSCPHLMMEVEYPYARMVFWMPGGFAGHGPLLDVDGYGNLQTWLYVSDRSNPGPPDYVEALSQREANRLFGLLAAVDFTDLPHPPDDYFECYPQLWRWWEQGPNYDPLVLDYPLAARLLPEMAGVYEFFDLLLCRSEGSTGYPETLPSQYCMFW